MLRVCIASIQNVKRSLLLLVVSASDIPLRTIKFFSVLFSSAYSSTLVSRRLCDLHCMVVGNCFCHFVVRTYNNRSIASGAWPTVSYSASSSVNVFGTSLRQPAIRPESPFLPIPTCIRRPRQEGSRRNIATPFGMEKQEWRGYPMVKNFKDMFIRFDMIHERNKQTDRRMDGRTPRYAQHHTAKT